MDYGYEDFLDITPEQVLQKVTPQQIFEWVLNEPFEFGKKYKSPFREHSKLKGTCRFEQRTDGTIIFVDFGDTTTHRTCFKLVMDYYTMTNGYCNLQDAIKLILSHFKLSTDTTDYEAVFKSREYIKTDQPSDVIITYDPRTIERRDKIHWSQFLIQPADLKEDNVFATSRFYIQNPYKSRKTVNVYGLCYAIDFIDAVKLYQPYSTDYKWITNCSEDNIGNFDNIDNTGDELIISKSYKDHRVIRNILFLKNVIWFQNEGMIPSRFILENLLERFKLITIFFDNDMAGIKAAIKLQDILNSIRISSTRRIMIPEIIGYKDPGETVCREGRQDTIKIFKLIGL